MSFSNIFVPNIRFRQIKIKTEAGFLACRKKLQSREKLISWLEEQNKRNPIKDIYFSVSCWLNPHKVRGYKTRRAGFRKLDLLLLKSDFVIDIDKDKLPQKTMQATYSELLKAKEILTDAGLKELIFVKTGRGYHAVALDWYKSFCCKNLEEPVGRVFYVTQRKIDFAKSLLKNGLKFDFPVSIDTFRVIRAWNSYHNNGTLCRYSNDIHSLHPLNKGIARDSPSYHSNQLRLEKMTTLP